MKQLIFCLLAVVTFSCNKPNEPQSRPIQQETPNVLKNESDVKLSLKRSAYGSDIFDELYAELSEKDPDLNTINKNLEICKQMYEDSIAPFNEYKNKSKKYYYEFKSRINVITDSTLKHNMNEMVALSEKMFNYRISSIEKLVKLMKDKELVLKDKYMVLKMVTTLKSIENFQKEMLVGNNELKNVIKEQDKLIATIQKKTN